MSRDFSENGDDDGILNESISEVDLDATSLDEDELRLMRIAEQRRAALRGDDPRRANIGALNTGLLEIAFHSETVVKTLLSTQGNSLEPYQVQQALRIHLSITREVGRFANLEARFDEVAQEAENAKAQRRVRGTPKREY